MVRRTTSTTTTTTTTSRRRRRRRSRPTHAMAKGDQHRVHRRHCWHSKSKSNSTGHAKALPATTRQGGRWYALLRTIAPWHVLHGLHHSSTLLYSNDGVEEEGLGRETPVARRRVGATRRGCTQDPGGGCATKRARYLRVGITCLLVLFLSIVHLLVFLFAPFFFRTLYICMFVCLFSEKGCGRGHSEDKGASGAQGM